MGTQLISHGVKLPLPLWSAQANIEEPQIVRSVHKDYVEAGKTITARQIKELTNSKQ